MPLALLADTECEDFERALATNVLGPFRLTKALLGSLAAAAREGRGAVVLNVSSDAAHRCLIRGGARTARARPRLRHLSRIWNEELQAEGIAVLSLDPGDMDTPLHAAAVPDADRSTLKRPETAARELADAIAAALRADGDSASPRRPPMIAATVPVQRPTGAKLLVVDAHGSIEHWRRADFVRLFRDGDLVIANDAATLPASLAGQHLPSGRDDRSAPGRPRFARTEVTALLRRAVRRRRLPHAHRGPARCRRRCVRAIAWRSGRSGRRSWGCSTIRASSRCEFEGSPDAIWAGLARHGRPIQYAHVPAPLALWDTWTPIAGPPVAFEPPSAGFVLDWAALASHARSAACGFATITHAAGISSTGDPALDALLPFDEPYRIPASTAEAIRAGTRARRRASSRSARPSSGHSSTPAAIDRRRAGRGRRGDRRESMRPAGCGSSTRFSPARTSPEQATTTCCARLSTTRR